MALSITFISDPYAPDMSAFGRTPFHPEWLEKAWIALRFQRLRSGRQALEPTSS